MGSSKSRKSAQEQVPKARINLVFNTEAASDPLFEEVSPARKLKCLPPHLELSDKKQTPETKTPSIEIEPKDNPSFSEKLVRCFGLILVAFVHIKTIFMKKGGQ